MNTDFNMFFNTNCHHLDFKSRMVIFKFFLLLFSRDALITCIVNTCTCLTAGVLVFSCLGYMAHLQGVTVHDVARSGPGLVFLTYPELVLSLPGSFIWAILFFAMLLVLGVDTEFCSVESLITGIVDNWSDKLLPHRKKVALGICVSLFLAGLPMCTNVSLYFTLKLLLSF